ncbi:glycosyltransferase family 2 protein [Desulfogranum japonicum]|uniref:glycosyltransferase family 2 protein n=1 Tax=Desulfogranum japonicum TaxID=231447 RepID=UPI0003FA8C8E|nr:glycosyltransferase family 2 protein [Desulfogranum japonicum]
MQVSLIITTYNWPRALQLSVDSVFRQSVLPVEIIVADDGSGYDTVQVVQELTKRSPVRLIHSWQEDNGFRLAMSRNKAIAKARGDYIILIDGDIILEKHFIEDHCNFATSGCFVQGTRVLLNEECSAQTLEQGELKVCLFSRGVENKKNCIRSPFLSRHLSFRSARIKGVKTCNFSFWKDDCLRINGFNEAFVGWGREDSEFTARLLNIGIERQNVRFRAIGYHLHHKMNTRDRLTFNDAILQETIARKLVWCDKGISQYL